MAKSMQMSLDRGSENTSVPTNTLDLILATLIDLGTQSNPMVQKIEAQQIGAVANHLKQFEKK